MSCQVQLHGRKLWRVFPPNQTRYLHPAKATEGGKGAHYTANTLAPDLALHPDLLRLEVLSTPPSPSTPP